MLKRLLALVVFLLGGLAIYLVLVPGPVDAYSWQPPPAPALLGVTAPNERLQQADLLGLGQIVGPEDVAVDAQGRAIGGLADGRIVRITGDDQVETWLNTGGRPLGMQHDAAGNLIVADSFKGLLSIDPHGQVSVLTTAAEGVPFRFTDDVDIAPDGRIYFSDASFKFSQPDYMLDLLELGPYGRLLRYDPQTKQTEVLLRDLSFANGVAVSPDGSFVLVNETWKYRILRYWLTGPKAGQAEIFADNLPGFPDGVSADPEGRFWVALPTLRNPQMDSMHPSSLIKNIVAKLPEFLRPKPQRYGFVLALNGDGQIIDSLHDTTGNHLNEITSVQWHDGALYFGTLHNDRIGRLAYPSVNAASDAVNRSEAAVTDREQTVNSHEDAAAKEAP